ncbi:MAG: ATP synthase F1 subunit gamma [Cyclobacteriaceae bacterium]
MANLKEVRLRISSVKSTQQITKAMKMVAAAKLKRAQDNIIKLRPYATKLNEVLGRVSSGETQSVFCQEKAATDKVLVVLITSDRGLCGAFNSNVIKGAIKTVETTYVEQFSAGNVDVLTIGKKGNEALARKQYQLNSDFVGLFSSVLFEDVKAAPEFIMEAFEKGTYDKVDIVFNEFKNVATQEVKVQQFLPLVEEEKAESTATEATADYIFEPSKEYIEEELIPQSLKIQFYKAVLESNASEHGARMTAMDKATDNAGELLDDLKLVYNTTRQAHITKEILEIVGGAAALEN